MKNFTLYHNAVQIISANGYQQTIFFNDDTGRVFFRYKIGSPWYTKHPAIYVGVDFAGNHLFMHNHYETGRPSLVTLADFTLGQPYYPYQVPVTNTRLQIIARGLNQILEGQPYHATAYNCQTFVNRAVNNTNQSEDLNKWITRLVIGAAIVTGINIMSSTSNNKY